MTKYAVNKGTFQFNPSKYKTVEEAFFDNDFHNDETISVCDTMEEALEILATAKIEYHAFSYSHATATYAYIEEADYDLNDDGEWEFVMGSDIWHFRCEEIPAASEDNE